jgi:phosphate:Na+ symporter
MEMLDDVRSAFLDNDPRKIDQVNETEKVVNDLNREITAYAAELGQASLPVDLSSVLSLYVNGIGDIERVGDHAQNLIEMYEMKNDQSLDFSEAGIEEFVTMFDKARDAFAMAMDSIRTEEMPDMSRVDALEDEIDHGEKELRLRHVARLSAGICSPSASVIFIDILSNLERIGDHAHNLSLSVADVARLHMGA